MPRISNVRWPKFDLRYGYLFDIRSEDELLHYWQVCRNGQNIEGWNDYMQSAEWQQASGSGPGLHHCTTPTGALLAVLVNAEQDREDFRRSPVQILADVQDKAFTQMRSAIAEHGQVFVNRNGGYFVPLPGFEITDTHDIKAYALPGSKITVTQWPNGIHWYARVGGEDVEMYGHRKWDTREEAEKIARKWAKERSITVE